MSGRHRSICSRIGSTMVLVVQPARSYTSDAGYQTVNGPMATTKSSLSCFESSGLQVFGTYVKELYLWTKAVARSLPTPGPKNVLRPVRALTAQGQLPLYELSMLVASGLSSSLPSRFASVGNSLPNRM